MASANSIADIKPLRMNRLGKPNEIYQAFKNEWVRGTEFQYNKP